MGWFSRKRRCRKCGQFVGAIHACTRKTPRVPTAGHAVGTQQISEPETIWDGIARAAEAFEASHSPKLTVWDHRPGHRGQRLTIPMPHSLDEQTREIFGRGHCHSLALAFKERGFQIAGIVSVHTLKEFIPAKTSHYFAVDPVDPEYGWDSRGRRPISEILSPYRQSRVFLVKNPQRAINSAIDDGVYLPVDLEAGRKVRDWILDGSEQQ